MQRLEAYFASHGLDFSAIQSQESQHRFVRLNPAFDKDETLQILKVRTILYSSSRLISTVSARSNRSLSDSHSVAYIRILRIAIGLCPGFVPMLPTSPSLWTRFEFGSRH